MATERRTHLSDPAALEALASPIRLDLLGFLMEAGPATASQCGRAVGASGSNCSYHLRVLAGHGLVEHVESADGRERPWRALVTGIDADPASDDEAVAAGSLALAEASLRLVQEQATEHLRTRHLLDPAWQEASAQATYGLRVTPAELADLTAQVDAVLRPYIAATREDAPAGARSVRVALLALPRGDRRR